ncbi:MAG: histidine phosphatase family protein [Clostridia bacterium]|nr:histidine phosphatase family protein [Clostridia bacterium]
MEIWDAYDREGNLTGEKLIRGEPVPAGRYHLVCEVLVRHTDGSYLCMRRSRTKDGYPGWPEATAGGSALAGEDRLACVRRELREDTGLDCGNFTEIGSSVSGDTIYHSFLCTVNCDKDSVQLQEGETEDFCWLSEAEFIAFVNSGRMIPVQRQRMDRWLRKMGYVRRKIHLVRHGADDETIRGGWSNHSLTEEGFAQAEKLAESIDFPVHRLYSSDLTRAMQTAAPVAEKLGLEITPMPQFRETNNGRLAGMKHELACEKISRPVLEYPGLG